MILYLIILNSNLSLFKDGIIICAIYFHFIQLKYDFLLVYTLLNDDSTAFVKILFKIYFVVSKTSSQNLLERSEYDNEHLIVSNKILF